jgi:hypothetical protein
MDMFATCLPQAWRLGKRPRILGGAYFYLFEGLGSDSQKTLTANDLRQFTGTELWYRHSLNRNVLYTDGVRYVADKGGAYWLIDEIALAQCYQPKVMKQEFQLWKLTVSEDSAALLTCGDGNGATVYEKAGSARDTCKNFRFALRAGCRDCGVLECSHSRTAG